MDTARYSHYHSSEMILRDHLALERTALANERTLLAYVRTMIGIVAVGGTLVKLFEGVFFAALGWMFIMLGILVMIVGFNRYIYIEHTLSTITQDSEFSTADKLHQIFWGILEKLHLAKLQHPQHE